MICGSVLSKVESTATFRLGAPRIVRPGECGTESTGVAPETVAVHVIELWNGTLTVVVKTLPAEASSAPPAEADDITPDSRPTHCSTAGAATETGI
jgi:hypothetical protein